MPLDTTIKHLYATDNAMVWAKEFVKTINTNPNIEIDEGFMVGWFANAMQTAIDHAQRRLSGSQ